MIKSKKMLSNFQNRIIIGRKAIRTTTITTTTTTTTATTNKRIAFNFCNPFITHLQSSTAMMSKSNMYFALLSSPDMRTLYGGNILLQGKMFQLIWVYGSDGRSFGHPLRILNYRTVHYVVCSVSNYVLLHGN